MIYRIFYYINRSGNGQLTLRELKRGNLIAAMQHADEEEDINKVMRFVYQGILCMDYCDKQFLHQVAAEYNLRKLLRYVFVVNAGNDQLF